MPEAHQPTAAVLILGRRNEPGPVVAFRVDLVEHLKHRLIRTAMERSPQGADAGRGAREQIGATGSDHAHGGRGAVLLVVGVQ